MKNHIKLFCLIVIVQSCRPSSSTGPETETQVKTEIKYETGGNDSAEIKLILHPDSTLSFYFRQFDPPSPAFESKGHWMISKNDIEVIFQKGKTPFKYKAVFSVDSLNIIVNDSTFRFDKDKRLSLWGVICDKTVTTIQ